MAASGRINGAIASAAALQITEPQIADYKHLLLMAHALIGDTL